MGEATPPEEGLAWANADWGDPGDGQPLSVGEVEQLKYELRGQGMDLRSYAPENGWRPEDFPKLSVVLIPYSSSTNMRSDPSMTIIPEGWMFIEVGNVRLAIPDREEWAKFVTMGEGLWNTFEQERAVDESTDVNGDAPEVGTPTEGVSPLLSEMPGVT